MLRSSTALRRRRTACANDYCGAAREQIMVNIVTSLDSPGALQPLVSSSCPPACPCCSLLRQRRFVFLCAPPLLWHALSSPCGKAPAHVSAMLPVRSPANFARGLNAPSLERRLVRT